MESPPFTLGRKHMKYRSALLLGGVVLLAAIPVCADSIPYTTSTNEPASSESSAPTFRTSQTKYLTLATARFFSESIPAVISTEAFALPAPAIAQDAKQAEISGNHVASFALALADSRNEASPSSSTPAMLAVNGFQPGGAFGGSGAENSWVLATLAPAASE